jgi:hypothetical protein
VQSDAARHRHRCRRERSDRTSAGPPRREATQAVRFVATGHGTRGCRRARMRVRIGTRTPNRAARLCAGMRPQAATQEEWPETGTMERPPAGDAPQHTRGRRYVIERGDRRVLVERVTKLRPVRLDHCRPHRRGPAVIRSVSATRVQLRLGRSRSRTFHNCGMFRGSCLPVSEPPGTVALASRCRGDTRGEPAGGVGRIVCCGMPSRDVARVVTSMRSRKIPLRW